MKRKWFGKMFKGDKNLNSAGKMLEFLNRNDLDPLDFKILSHYSEMVVSQTEIIYRSEKELA
jgi:hypothetical protein